MYVENEPQQENQYGIQKDTSYAAIIHLSSFIGFLIPFGSIIAPLILWLIKKDQDTFIDYHGKACVNFEISMLIYSLVVALLAIPFSIITLGIGAIALIGLGIMVIIAYVVFKIQATIKASNGEYYQYPFTLELIK